MSSLPHSQNSPNEIFDIQLSTHRSRLKQEICGDRLETFAEALIRVLARLIALASFGRLHLRAWGVSLAIFVVLAWGTASISLISPLSNGKWDDIVLILYVHTWAAAVAVLQLRSSRFFARLLLSTLADSVIDRIKVIEDLRDLNVWLRKSYNKSRQFYFCLTVSIGLTLISFGCLFFSGEQKALLNFGTFLLFLISWFLGATGWYFFFLAVTLSSRLARYRLEMFEFEPASSPLITSICAMMHAALFVSAVIATIFTTGLFLFALKSNSVRIVFSLVCAWGPMVFTMLYYQYALFKLIRRSRMSVIVPLQGSIAAFQQNMQHLDGSDIEKLNKLLDLHKRVCSSNSTALDWRGSFATINTLLLPLASLLIANFLHPTFPHDAQNHAEKVESTSKK